MSVLTVERLSDGMFRISGEVIVSLDDLLSMTSRISRFPAMYSSQEVDGKIVSQSIPKLFCDDERVA
jgi:hypothetical protein